MFYLLVRYAEVAGMLLVSCSNIFLPYFSFFVQFIALVYNFVLHFAILHGGCVIFLEGKHLAMLGLFRWHWCICHGRGAKGGDTVRTFSLNVLALHTQVQLQSLFHTWKTKCEWTNPSLQPIKCIECFRKLKSVFLGRRCDWTLTARFRLWRQVLQNGILLTEREGGCKGLYQELAQQNL